MSVYIGDVQTFAGVIADKPQVLKIGEETMEVFSAWEDYKYAPEFRKEALIAEIADVIQAACNLLAAIGVDDMRQPMQACYVRNRERGREYASSDDMDSAVYVQKCTNESCRQYVDQGERAELPDCESDSREKLEADVRQLAFDYAPSSDSSDEYALRAKVMKLLDRQAAITEEQTRYKWVTASAHEIAELKRERDRLSAERDEWKAKAEQAASSTCSNGTANRTGNGTCPDSDEICPNDVDSREKLEADACQFVARAWEAGRNFERRDLNTRSKDVAWSSDELIALLDRQAAITERECRKPNWDYCETCEALEELQDENDGLKARVESLRAKLSKMLDAASAIQHIGDLP